MRKYFDYLVFGKDVRQREYFVRGRVSKLPFVREAVGRQEGNRAGQRRRDACRDRVVLVDDLRGKRGQRASWLLGDGGDAADDIGGTAPPGLVHEVGREDVVFFKCPKERDGVGERSFIFGDVLPNHGT